MYKFYCNNPANNLRAGDCVIRAISKVTGDTWEKVYTELSVEGYGLADWANANHVWDTYLRRNGFKRYICPNDWGMTPSERRRMSNRSMANKRMYNRSRNSYNNSYYSGDAKMDFMAEVESLMNRAPDEHTRMKIERMLNDLR